MTRRSAGGASGASPIMSSGTSIVRSPSGSATRTVSPAIHKVPPVPAIRVWMSIGPHDAALDCITPSTPERVRKWTV